MTLVALTGTPRAADAALSSTVLCSVAHCCGALSFQTETNVACASADWSLKRWPAPGVAGSVRAPHVLRDRRRGPLARLLALLALGVANTRFTGLTVVRKAVRTAVVRGVAEGVADGLARLVSHLGA